MSTTTDAQSPASASDGDPATDRFAVPAAATGSRGRRLVRGRPEDPSWVRPTFWLLLVATAVTYLWDLGAAGWSNSFYAAAVQAGTQSWKAWLFGALDAPGLITVDKPPASMWVMALSGRIFGFSTWSMLVPEALMGVASVALVYAMVRRWSGPRTALAAASLVAFMPAAALMFKFNNPDAMLVLCMVLAAWTTVRAVDAAGTKAGTWWLVAAGAFVGLGFLTKQLQVMLVVPGLALVYLVAAPTRLRRRIGDLVAAGVAIVVSAGWYVALVQIWPASSRPYIGGSTDNSLLELALGYNGLQRVLGGEGGPGGGGGRRGAGGMPGGMPGGGGVPGGAGGPGGMPGGGPGGPGGMPGGGFGGSPSLGRLFTSEFSGNASWLLPGAIVLLLAGLWFTRRAPRTDRTRALLLLGGGWLVVHALVFSEMSGIIHPYYTVAMVPGVAVTAAAGASILWRERARLAARIVLAVTVAGTAAWSAVVLTQADWGLWLRWVVVAAGVLGAIGLLLPRLLVRRAVAVVVAVLALVGTVGASTAFAAVTAATPHQGSVVSAGPDTGNVMMGGPGGPGGAGREGGAQADRMRGMGGGPGMGEQTSPELVALLRSAGTRWAAATTGAMNQAGLQLSSGVPVMAMGGFMGSDPAPTLAQFQEYVATGQIRYYVVGGGPGGGMGPGGPGGAPGAGAQDRGATGGPMDRGTTGEITSWVTSHFTKIEVGGRTVYDLSRPLS
ncbi:glycosyltransferase family 39 protein [Actinomycetospora sp. TBRC 11914]|uniref:ArnT family glycosyltransferase n=1 Tax=Actinomycetospora sp. TBRC 11914 TaxID=2729387 RepID=UPI00145D6B3C|nr:glycosyltransferase family 39 protein [Actinomycetospora sp. TBRC 11914]NMO89262.1 glycosyltransferase family 39 protein [Actinomycetospora sp. TBRC 11914]